MRTLAAFTLGLFFLFPLLVLFSWFGFFVAWPSSDFYTALVGGATQSLLSSLGCLAFGFWGACGFLWVRAHWPKAHGAFVVLALVPGFLPPLLIIVLVFGLWSGTPLGLGGVVFFHCLMNVGLTAFLMERLLLEKTQEWSNWARVEGLSPWTFFYRGLMPNWSRESFAVMSFLVLIFMTSFSIPFLLAGGRYGGVEVLLYEQIFLLRDWSQAGVTALIFCFLILLLGQLNPIDPIRQTRQQSHFSQHILSFRSGLFPLLLPVVVLMLGLSVGLVGEFNGGIPGAAGEEILFEYGEFLNTLLLGVGVGLMTLALGSIYVFCFLSAKISRYIFFFVPPGWMVVAFSFFLLPGQSSFWEMTKAMIAMTFIFVPFLFRYGLFQKIDDLRGQAEVARSMGVPWRKIFFQVLWPQTLPVLALLSGLAGVWACGDFAMSGVLIANEDTIALTMKNLMVNYRSMESFHLVPGLILAMVLVLLLFQGLSHVARKKSF